MLVFLVCISATLALHNADEDICKFESEKPIAYEDAKNCLNSIPIQAEEQSAVISILKQYAEEYVFKDILFDPPAPTAYLAVNLTAEIETLSSKTFASTSEFYQNVSRIFHKLRDPHTTFHKPCSSEFLFVLPFSIRALADADEEKITLTFDQLPEHIRYVTSYYIGDDQTKNITGYEITGLNVDGQDITPDSPEAVLMKWADEHVYISKYSPARFNKAISRDFYHRHQEEYNIPPSSSITVKAKKPLQQRNGNDDEEITVQLPWYGVVFRNTTTLSELCPLNTTKEMNMKEIQKKKSNSIVRIYRNLVQKLKTKKNLKQSDKLNKEQIKSISNDDSDLGLVIQNREIRYYYSNSTTTGYLRIATFTPEYNQGNFSNFVDTLIKVVEDLHIRNASRLVIDVRGNPGGFVSLGLRSLQYLSGNTVYPLFGELDTRHSQIHDELFDAGLLDPINHLEYLTQKLQKKWYNPGLNRTFTSQIPTDNQKQNKNKNGDAFNHTYSNRYTVNIFENEKEFESTYDRLKITPNFTLDQQHLLFLTDGLCGSTCAYFLKRVQEAHVGKIIGLGLDPYRKTSENGLIKDIIQTAPQFDVASYAGGYVVSSHYVHEKKSLLPKREWKSIPPPFPRYGSHVSWTVQEIFSYKNETKNTPLEFLVNPPDLIHQYFPDPVDEFEITRIQKLFNVITPAFDKCAPWEVNQTSSCDPTDTKKDHAQYGNPCDATTKTFDDTKCVFSRCDTGYYLNPQTGNCTVIPKDYKSGFSKLTIIIFIVICAVALLLVIGLIILIVCLCKRQKRRSSYQQLP